MMSAEMLVSKQLMLCELKRRLEREGHRPAPVHVADVPYGPCLLISREHGAGGERIARFVGQQLGWRVFDREIVDEIASRAHIRRRLVESVDETLKSKWEEVWRELAEGQGMERSRYTLYLRQVVEALGHHGDVVILGRGAHYVLPADCALRVRVVAPKEWRARNVAERTGVSLASAHQAAERSDARRTTFIHDCFARDDASPLGYDLVVNTGTLPPERAGRVVLAALREKLRVAPNHAGATTDRRAA